MSLQEQRVRGIGDGRLAASAMCQPEAVFLEHRSRNRSIAFSASSAQSICACMITVFQLECAPMSSYPIQQRPIHLGRGATAVVQPEFTGSMDWYGAYVQRHQSDGVEGRLVSQFSFDKPWDMWEMHPAGSEVVLCIAGCITLHQEHPDGTRNCISIRPGEYAINPPGTWHTADVKDRATAVFITAGAGTQHRPRMAGDTPTELGCLSSGSGS